MLVVGEVMTSPFDETRAGERAGWKQPALSWYSRRRSRNSGSSRRMLTVCSTTTFSFARPSWRC